MGCVKEPNNISSLVAFLCFSSYNAGPILCVDGGATVNGFFTHVSNLAGDWFYVSLQKLHERPEYIHSVKTPRNLDNELSPHIV